MNLELMTATSESILILRGQLLSVMAEPPVQKQPIIQKILETVTLLRDLSRPPNKLDVAASL
jgi:hypothetical protein